MIYTPIKDLKEGETYDQVFMLDEVTPVLANGKNFVKFSVRDVTGTISGVCWELKLKPAGSAMSTGNFIEMKVQVSNYKNKKQLVTSKENLKSFKGKPENIIDYIPGEPESVINFYTEELNGYINKIKDPDLKDIINNANSRVDIIQMLKESPFGLNGPLAHRGGLLLYVVNTIAIAKSIMKGSKRIIESDDFNSCLVVAGCILRYIGWATTVKFDGNFIRPDNSYFMTGIDRASFRFTNHLMIHAESDLSIEIPESKKQALENICQPTKNIKTLEGHIVHCAFNVASLMYNGQNLLNTNRYDSEWSSGGELFFGHL